MANTRAASPLGPKRTAGPADSLAVMVDVRNRMLGIYMRTAEGQEFWHPISPDKALKTAAKLEAMAVMLWTGDPATLPAAQVEAAREAREKIAAVDDVLAKAAT